MKKTFTILIAAIAAIIMMTQPKMVWGQTRDDQQWSHEFVSGDSYSNNSVTVNGVTWNVSTSNPVGSPSIAFGNMQKKYALKFGSSGSHYYPTIELSTDYFTNYNVKSVTVDICNNGNKTGTLTVTQGSTTIGTTSAYFGQTWTNLTANTSTGSGGTLTLSYSVAQACGIHSITVVYTTGGGSTTYTVTYDCNGGTSGCPENVSGISPNTSIDLATAPSKTGHDFANWSDGTSTYNAGVSYTVTNNVTFTAQWTAHTHNVTMPSSDQYGSYTSSAITSVAYGTTVNLTYTPASGYESYVAIWSVNGEAISGETFTMPDEDVTVGVTLNNYTKDELNYSFTGVSSGGYTNWSDRTGTSGAVYAGRTAGSSNNNYLQLNYSTSSSAGAYHSGIITTGSGGKVKKVIVTWAANGGTMPDTRVLKVYGSNTAYSETADLYDSNKQGTLLGSIAKGTGTTLNIGGDYKYVGLLTDGAAYFTQIEVYWEPTPTYTVTGVADPVEAGSVTVTTSPLEEGGTTQVSATTNPGYALDHWTVSGTGSSLSSTTDNPTTLTMGSANATITATFVVVTTYDVAIDGGIAGGTVTSNFEHAAEGTIITLTATPSAGYTFDNIATNWLVSPDVAITPGDNNTATFEMPANNVTVSANFTAKKSYKVTYKANGGSESDITDNYYEGDDVTVRPASTFSYTNHVFTIWNTAADGNGTDYQPGSTIENISSDVILYAQWTEIRIDELTASWTGVTETGSYSSWSNKHGSSSDAVYAGNSAKNSSGDIQLRSNNSNSGIVSTSSGGKAKKVVVTWGTGNAQNRTLNIYGKNTAYSQATDLYNSSTYGNLLGTIVYGTSTELTVNDDYKYIGMRSSDGAMYIANIEVSWQPATISTPTFSTASGIITSTTNVEITCATGGATIYYTLDGSNPTNESEEYTSAITVSETTTIKAIAIKGSDVSEIATATYTFVTPYTSIQNLSENASSTTTQVAITFNDWVVSGNNGGTTPTQAYLSDGTEYGCIIYRYEGHGFNAGDILNGTVLCNLSTYTSNGYTYVQLTNLTRETEGLHVTTAGTATSTVKTIDALVGNNIGAVFTLKDITYKESNYFQDASSNNINLSTMLYTPSPSLVSDKLYDITGVFTVGVSSNETNKRINPRSSADVVVKANMSLTDLTEFTYIVDNGPSEKQKIDIYGSDFASNLTVTASGDYEISLDNTTYYASLDLEQTSGSITGALYVRLKSGLSIGEHNGNLTFTANNLTTKVVNLVGSVTASPTYTITLTQISGGTISADKLVAEAGETITLSAEFDDDCTEVTEWTVFDGSEEPVKVTDNQFTMPASNVTVEATFGTKTFTMSYSVNGIIEHLLDKQVDCGDDATLYTASDLVNVITLPTGFTIKGWSTSAGSTATVASFTPTENTILYAVLIPEGAFVGYVRVTELSEITEGTYFIVNDGYVLPSATTTSSPVKTSDYYIGTPLDSYNSLPVAGTEWIFTGTNTEMTIKNSAGMYLYVSANDSKNLRVSTTEDTWCFEENDRYGVTTCGFAMKDATYGRYCASYSGGSDWRSYTSANYGNYGNFGILYLYKKVEPDVYNTVTEIASTTEMTTDITETDLVIVKTGGVLTLTGQNQGTAENLIIKDGGQLKVYVTDTKDGEVQATVEKNIIGYGNNDEVKDGWNFIASPINDVNDLAPTSVTNMTENNYDLYQLNNTSWENYKEHEGNANPGFNLTNGRGYLYANSNNVTLEFAGTVKPFVKDGENTVSVAAGWNLIGNPFTFNVYADVPYYAMNAEGTGITANTVATSTAIAPCTSIVIKAENASTVNFSETSPVLSTGDHGNLQMVLAHNVNVRGDKRVETIDNAIVSFNEGSQLEKFYFGNPSASIFIPQNGEDYAIAFSDRQGDVPLYFKANETGTYTISFAGDEMSLNGIYLIDILAEEEIDLSVNPSYTFIGSPADRMARFKIVFRNANGDGTSDIFAYQNGNDIVVTGEGELQIFDVMGRMVSTQRVNGVETVNVKSQGVYIFRLNEKTQKIVVR